MNSLLKIISHWLTTYLLSYLVPKWSFSCFGAKLSFFFLVPNCVFPFWFQIFRFYYLSSKLSLHHFEITRPSAALRGRPCIVRSGYILSGDILRFPNVSLRAAGAQLVLDVYLLSQFKDRQNMTHKQTDTASKIAHFS